MTDVFDLLFFLVRGRRCAVDVACVREVVSAPLVTPVPLVPPVIRGALSFHGLPLVVLDLGVELLAGSLEASPPQSDASSLPKSGYVLVVEANLPDDGMFGRAALSVDTVMRVVSVPSNAFRPRVGPPPFVSATVADSEGPALLIDVPMALAYAMSSIRQGRQAA